MKSIKRIFILIFINIVVFEGLLHIVPPFDRYVTYEDAEIRGKNDEPNAEYTYIGNNIGMISPFKVHVKNNSLGFHDKEYSFYKKPGTKRILILGDSQVEAIQVAISKTFHKILEKELNEDGYNVEVIALGKSGYGIKEAIDTYENIGKKYNPDIVIWAFLMNNDIQDTDRKFGKLIRNRELSDIPDIPDFLKFSKIATFLYTYSRKADFQRITQSRLQDTTIFSGKFSYINKIENWDYIPFLKKWSPIFSQIWDSFAKYYIDFINKVHSDGRILITVSISGVYPYFLLKSNPDIDWDFNKPNRLVEELSKENSVEFLSMKSVYESYSNKTGKSVTFGNDGHLDEAGHRLMAGVLYKEIIKYLTLRSNTTASSN